VRAGDVFVLEVPGRAPVVFRVSETAVVDARTAAVAGDETGSALVLLTCYPFDAVTAGGPLRYVVMAERAEG
jgi:sortase A